jgi:hypothetical protein
MKDSFLEIGPREPEDGSVGNAMRGLEKFFRLVSGPFDCIMVFITVGTIEANEPRLKSVGRAAEVLPGQYS